MSDTTASTINKLVLVTGATGFIAGHIIEQLHKRSYRVRGTVRSTRDPKRFEYLKILCPNIELFEADLLKFGSFTEAAKGCDYVIHTASPVQMQATDTEEDLLNPSIKGTLNVLDACKKK